MDTPIQAIVIPVTPFQQNCTVIWCSETKLAAISDPGGDIDRIKDGVEQSGATVEKIILTHAHIDHAGASAALSEHFGVPIEGPHIEDTFLIDGIEEQGEKFGFEGARHFTPERFLNSGDTVTVGAQTLEVLHCPGHTPGHVIFFHRAAQLAIVGDVLFQGSIGRTDFPRGDHDTLIRSITQNLWPLGNEVTFIPGHGPASTFGAERKSNPFVGDQVLAGTGAG